MEKIEIKLWGLFIIAFILFLFRIKGGSFLLIILSGSLSIIYSHFGFIVFNSIKMKDIFLKETYKSISKRKIIGSVLTGISLSILVIGILFKLFHWPGSHLNIMVGLIGSVIALIVSIIKNLKTKNLIYKKVIKRISFIGGFACLLLMLNQDAIDKFKYRDYPDYLKALENYRKDPTNELLQEELYKEEQKTYK